MVKSKLRVQIGSKLTQFYAIFKRISRRRLGWKSPFEVYYRKKSNMVANASHKNDKTISKMPTSNEPTSTKNVKYRSQRVKSFEQKQRTISNA